jgi:hypothetical protein
VAIVSLLSIANADLADARLVLRTGQTPNAGVIGSQAIAHLIRVLGNSEHGWPPATGQDVIEAIPLENPFRHSLFATETPLADAADQPIGTDGRLTAVPDSTATTAAPRLAPGTEASWASSL